MIDEKKMEQELKKFQKIMKENETQKKELEKLEEEQADKRKNFEKKYEAVITGRTTNPFEINNKEKEEKYIIQQDKTIEQTREEIELKENNFKRFFNTFVAKYKNEVEKEKEEIVKSSDISKMQEEKEKAEADKAMYERRIQEWENNGMSSDDIILRRLKEKVVPELDEKIKNIDEKIDELDEPKALSERYNKLENIEQILNNAHLIKYKIEELCKEIGVEEKDDTKEEKQENDKEDNIPEQEEQTKDQEKEEHNIENEDEKIIRTSNKDEGLEQEEKRAFDEFDKWVENELKNNAVEEVEAEVIEEEIPNEKKLKSIDIKETDITKGISWVYMTFEDHGKTDIIEADFKEAKKAMKSKQVKDIIKKVYNDYEPANMLSRFTLKGNLNPLIINALVKSEKISEENKQKYMEDYISGIYSQGNIKDFEVIHEREDSPLKGHYDRVMNNAARALENVEGAQVSGIKKDLGIKGIFNRFKNTILLGTSQQESPLLTEKSNNEEQKQSANSFREKMNANISLDSQKSNVEKIMSENENTVDVDNEIEQGDR